MGGQRRASGLSASAGVSSVALMALPTSAPGRTRSGGSCGRPRNRRWRARWVEGCSGAGRLGREEGGCDTAGRWRIESYRAKGTGRERPRSSSFSGGPMKAQSGHSAQMRRPKSATTQADTAGCGSGGRGHSPGRSRPARRGGSLPVRVCPRPGEPLAVARRFLALQARGRPSAWVGRPFASAVRRTTAPSPPTPAAAARSRCGTGPLWRAARCGARSRSSPGPPMHRLRWRRCGPAFASPGAQAGGGVRRRRSVQRHLCVCVCVCPPLLIFRAVGRGVRGAIRHMHGRRLPADRGERRRPGARVRARLAD